MSISKRFALVGSAFSGLPRLFQTGEVSATVLLHHKFTLPGESWSQSLEKLRRRLHWLRSNYRPISVPNFVDGLRQNNLPSNSLVFTTDDARQDVYEAAEEFRAFEIPLAMFVCVGWVTSEDNSETNNLARVIDAIEWYQGSDVRITYGKGRICDLSYATRSSTIDWILKERDSLRDDELEELLKKIVALRPRKQKRTLCNWAELASLAECGVHIGAHSVTHVRLAESSVQRCRFEICESKRVLTAKFGECRTFAYPFGTIGTYSDATLAELRVAGFEAAFLSHSDFVSASSEIFELPRITIPDGPIPFLEYVARVRGGGVPAQRCKNWLQKGRVT